jgi:hypothetical protein
MTRAKIIKIINEVEAYPGKRTHRISEYPNCRGNLAT